MVAIAQKNQNEMGRCTVIEQDKAGHGWIPDREHILLLLGFNKHKQPPLRQQV